MKKLLMFIAGLVFVTPVWAENTLTLPQGRLRARLKPIYASNIKQRYDHDRSKISLVSDFEKALDVEAAKQFNPQLALLMRGHGLLSMGTFIPSLSLSTLVLGTAMEYGVTDNLTFGVTVPIVTANTKFGLHFAKTDEALQAEQLDPRLALDFAHLAEKKAIAQGYRPFENWNKTGLGDIEAGFKYRFLRTNALAMTTKAGVRLPTGRADDPDHLTDIGFGDGQTDLGTTLLIDYLGIPHLLINALAKYTLQLPDKQLMRIPEKGELFTKNREELDRNLGNQWDASLYTEYQFLSLFNINAAYNYVVKEADRYHSNSGLNTDRLELHSKMMKQTADMGIGFSTVPWVQQGAFTIPMDVSLTASWPITGQNVARAQTVDLEYKLYF